MRWTWQEREKREILSEGLPYVIAIPRTTSLRQRIGLYYSYNTYYSYRSFTNNERPKKNLSFFLSSLGRFSDPFQRGLPVNLHLPSAWKNIKEGVDREKNRRDRAGLWRSTFAIRLDLLHFCRTLRTITALANHFISSTISSDRSPWLGCEPRRTEMGDR